MSFEVRVVRQMVPTSAIFPSPGIIPAPQMNVVDLIPPDDSGEWRFRHMQLLDAPDYDPGYCVPSSFSPGMVNGYTVPARAVPSQSEALVIWERYKERQHEDVREV